MKKQVEKYLPAAIDIIVEVEIANEKLEVENKFNGYFSSLGAAIVQSGLIPALAFFSNENSEASRERAKILKAIYKLVVVDEGQIPARALLDYAIKSNDIKLTSKIIDATVALKLATRTYNLKK